ncbi:hypothetical protein H9L10_03665 [Phycicoccus endophyticus]|uniref:Uncharacterized protein n=1 Tax=Phycicoccus endophyticus TaxID=1690220 RepID=A0A7G9R3J2_9MICO|nr:hypothetical protein [Phycicoccus endophyticus]NHI19923.1 hypothetical protein [Phycicoccus endophyticus]QNN50167.1 hypothetical protein H9L10_03665 [Phycicoccus endophyticus]GGL27490.1 hypothetical protein GCM10012283_07100 [Phycicoccus endophyticus]
MTLTTRRPTGLPAWPILLIAGVEKSGKTYAAAAASASALVGRTLWVGVGEDDPDEYGAIPGARFEIVEHDGTYRGILGVLDECVTELAKTTKGDRPGLIVLDSATRLWNLLSDEAQEAANRRARKKAQQNRKPEPEGDATISMDLWNLAKQRWDHVMDCLREHQGPSIVTARLDLTSVVNDRGDPTPDRVWKVQAHKSLPYDVGAIVELPAPGEAVLTGVRSLRVKNAQVARRPFPQFTVEKLWTEMGLAETSGPRRHTTSDAAASVTADDRAAHTAQTLIAQIADLTQAKGIDPNVIVRDWMDSHNGQHIKDATDVGALELLRDDLAAKETPA